MNVPTNLVRNMFIYDNSYEHGGAAKLEYHMTEI